jgi:hypothetical protein
MLYSKRPTLYQLYLDRHHLITSTTSKSYLSGTKKAIAKRWTFKEVIILTKEQNPITFSKNHCPTACPCGTNCAAFPFTSAKHNTTTTIQVAPNTTNQLTTRHITLRWMSILTSNRHSSFLTTFTCPNPKQTHSKIPLTPIIRKSIALTWKRNLSCQGICVGRFRAIKWWIWWKMLELKSTVSIRNIIKKLKPLSILTISQSILTISQSIQPKHCQMQTAPLSHPTLPSTVSASKDPNVKAPTHRPSL